MNTFYVPYIFADRKWLPLLSGFRVFSEKELLEKFGIKKTGQPRPAAGAGDQLRRFWNQRVERLLAGPGGMIWGEMKQNAQALSGEMDAGVRLLFKHLNESEVVRKRRVRLHLVGHSAGSIARAYLIDRLAAQEWDFESVTFMAPAIRVDTFDERVRPWLEAGRVKKLREFHLTDTAERQDPTMEPLLGYTRSLLYLVSRSFEGGREVPILGMEKHFPADLTRMRSHC